jgi:hypothetical protein
VGRFAKISRLGKPQAKLQLKISRLGKPQAKLQLQLTPIKALLLRGIVDLL